MESIKWKLNVEEASKWGRNTLVFFAPVVVIYLGSVLEPLQDGFAWSDFVPSAMVVGAMALYIVNVLLDFFKKLSAGQ